MSMNRMGIAAGLVCVLLCGTGRADNIDDLMEKIRQYTDAENYPKALEEVTWLRKEIQTLNTGAITTMLPAKLGEFGGGDAKVESVMGMTSVQKPYTKGRETVNLNLTQMGSGGMGGIAGLGAMAAMMGNSQNAVRILGFTARIQAQGNTSKLTVFLDGATLELRINRAKTGLALKTLAEQLPLKELNTYMRGQK